MRSRLKNVWLMNYPHVVKKRRTGWSKVWSKKKLVGTGKNEEYWYE